MKSPTLGIHNCLIALAVAAQFVNCNSACAESDSTATADLVPGSVITVSEISVLMSLPLAKSFYTGKRTRVAENLSPKQLVSLIQQLHRDGISMQYEMKGEEKVPYRIIAVVDHGNSTYGLHTQIPLFRLESEGYVDNSLHYGRRVLQPGEEPLTDIGTLPGGRPF